MIRRMLLQTLLAALIVAGLGVAYQTVGPGTGMAALAGYTSPAPTKGHHKRHDD